MGIAYTTLFSSEENVEEDFYYIHSPDWVVVIGRTKEGDILLVRQFRWGIDDFSCGALQRHHRSRGKSHRSWFKKFREETGFEAQMVP